MKPSLHPGAFGAVPEEFCQYETVAIAILPVPYDGTSTWMKGADRGPRAILEASVHMELYDIETNSIFYNLEASRRLGDSWKLELEARFYENAPPEDPAYGFRNDDYFQIILGYYY